MSETTIGEDFPRLATGISGLDHVTGGGLPEGRVTLLGGTTGSGKTVLAAQFLAAGIVKFGQPGVFVTFEESPDEIRRNVASFGWDIASWEADGSWAFVDGSAQADEASVVIGSYDLGGLLARVEAAVRRLGAKRVSLDSIGAILARFDDVVTVRTELLRLQSGLKTMSVTSILTAERSNDYDGIAWFGAEEFVTDNVVLLRHALAEEKRRRTIEVLKFRGASHRKGEVPFAVLPDRGIMVIPLSSIELSQKSSPVRVTSGIPEFDSMCGGGPFRDSIILVSGPTGTGKTLMAAAFVSGATSDERALLFAFEESRGQLFRNAQSWGFDFEAMEASGRLRVIATYPESGSLEDHLASIKQTMDESKPTRVAVDSLSALQNLSTARAFREFMIGLTAFLKDGEVMGLLTSTTESLLGGGTVSDLAVSTLSDMIVLLRYVEVYGEVRRGVTVLKMRGSAHEKTIREFTIDSSGMRIGLPLRRTTGILDGRTSQIAGNEGERVISLFPEDA